jgi:hypothetical protein
MSTTTHVDHHITDHHDRWSRTGSDGARLDRCGMRRAADLRPLPDVTIAIATGLGRCIVPPGIIDQGQPRRRSATAAHATTIQSP